MYRRKSEIKPETMNCYFRLEKYMGDWGHWRGGQFTPCFLRHPTPDGRFVQHKPVVPVVKPVVKPVEKPVGKKVISDAVLNALEAVNPGFRPLPESGKTNVEDVVSVLRRMKEAISTASLHCKEFPNAEVNDSFDAVIEGVRLLVNPPSPPSLPLDSEDILGLDTEPKSSNWIPACGGTEQKFTTKTGRHLLYVWQPSTGKHAYLDCDRDVVLTDDEAWEALGN